MSSFVYDALPARIVFGAGRRAELTDEVDALDRHRVMVVADANAKSIADGLVQQLGDRVVGRWHDVAQHVPVDLAEAARAATSDVGADAIVCVGGGSATGLAKAIALTLDTRIVAVPTTYAGSEVTPIYGLTGEHKQTGRDQRVLPRVVIYDAELTLDLPAAVTVPSVFNALAHCVEAFYGAGASPITSLMAEEGVRALGAALPRVVAAPRDLDGRAELLYGAYLAGASFAVAGVALHHRICHVLGGTYGLVHGDVNAVMLPHVVAYNAPAVPDEMERVAAALGADDAATGLYDLGVGVDAPRRLSDLGMPEIALGEAAERAAAETTVNPRPVDAESLRRLLDDAWHGRRPIARGS